MTTDRPNVLIFHVDNLGYGELGCYGGGILRGADTKRLDDFAEDGFQMMNYAPEAQCTPTRSAIMTGRYSFAPAPRKRLPVAFPAASSPGKRPWATSFPKRVTKLCAWANGTLAIAKAVGPLTTALTSGMARPFPGTPPTGKGPVVQRRA